MRYVTRPNTVIWLRSVKLRRKSGIACHGTNVHLSEATNEPEIVDIEIKRGSYVGKRHEQWISKVLDKLGKNSVVVIYSITTSLKTGKQFLAAILLWSPTVLTQLTYTDAKRHEKRDVLNSTAKNNTWLLYGGMLQILLDPTVIETEWRITYIENTTWEATSHFDRSLCTNFFKRI